MNKKLLAPILLASAVTSAYLIFRPRMLQWGATDEESKRPLPGDDLVRSPKMIATRAITVNAPRTAVWPWLLQIGQGRGGFYSYDWLENMMGLDIHTVRQIDPELQNLQVGDKIRLMPENPDVDLAFTVAILEPQRALVLVTPGDLESNFEAGYPFASWAFVLAEAENGRTRLIVRFQSDYKQDLEGIIANQIVTEPAHFIMERKMMITFKELAEELAAQQNGAGTV